jgi:hypothetical protein
LLNWFGKNLNGPRVVISHHAAEVSIHGQPIVLCHYALRVWNRSNHGSWHLYGHSHGRLLETPNSLSMDVGVDTHDFRPWHYDEIADIMRKKTENRGSGGGLRSLAIPAHASSQRQESWIAMLLLLRAGSFRRR